MSWAFARSRTPTASGRLSILTTIAFAVGTAAAFGIVYSVVVAGIRERSDAWLVGEAETLAQVYESTPPGRRDETLVEEIAEIASHEIPLPEGMDEDAPRPVFFLVNGRVDTGMLWSGPAARQPFIDAVARRSWSPGVPVTLAIDGWPFPFRVVCRETAGGESVYLGFHDSEARALVQEVGRTFALLWVAMLIFGFAISCLGAWTILRRVDHITDTALRIRSEEIASRVPVGRARDEISRLAAAFNDMLDRIEISMQRIRRVSDDVAHDLRSPLTAIRGNLELALHNVSGPSEELLAGAIDEIDRLRRIIGTSLDISESEAGALALERRDIDLAAMLSEMVEVYRPAAEEQGLDLRFDASAPVHAAVDRSLISRAMANLLDNALQHLPSCTRVVVAVRRDDDQAIIEVADNGPGFPPEIAGRVFDRFARGQRSRGSGLGLALVRAAARSHGGDASVARSPEGDTVVRVRIPVTANPVTVSEEDTARVAHA